MNQPPAVRTRLANYNLEHDHPWFYYLKSQPDRRDTGLEGFYGLIRITTPGGVIIARDVKGKKGAVKRFAYFPTINSAVEHLRSWPVGERHFYELIGGTTPQQKPYFDLDMSAEVLKKHQQGDEPLLHTAHRWSQIICSTICSCGIEWGMQFKPGQIQVWHTRYPEPAKKYSFHIIVQGWAFSNYQLMSQFGNEIKNIVEKLFGLEISKFIDDIWDASRQLRLYQSSKLDSPATKFRLFFPEHPFDYLITGPACETNFEESFVTNIEDCQIIDRSPHEETEDH